MRDSNSKATGRLFPWGSRRPLPLLVLAAGLMAAPAEGQVADTATLPWGYASYFGTGWYDLADGRDVYVLQLSMRRTLREAMRHEQGFDAGYELRLPLSIGLNRFGFDDPTGIVDTDNLGSVSFTPGIEVTLPVSNRLTLRPFAAVGWGTVLGESDAAWTYWAGMKSRVELDERDRGWALLGSAGYVGVSPNGEPSRSFWPVMAGIEYEHAPAGMRLGGKPAFFALHAAYTRFFGELEFVGTTGAATASVDDQWEFGFAVGRVDEPFRLWRFSFERLGLAYRFSARGNFDGVALIVRSLFDR